MKSYSPTFLRKKLVHQLLTILIVTLAFFQSSAQKADLKYQEALKLKEQSKWESRQPAKGRIKTLVQF